MNDNHQTWEKVLAIIKEETTTPSFNHWFASAHLHSLDDTAKIAYLETQDEFNVRILNNRYKTMLENTFKTVLQEDYRVIVRKTTDYENEPEKPEAVIRKEKAKVTYVNKEFRNQRIFNPKFNFDNFVVGESNELAYAVAKAVAEYPAQSYNPLFLHGKSGLGKTHLMHAIGIYLLENNNDLNVLYVSSEMFTNELIKALGEKNGTREFKNKYRKVDVLLIDDIQFLEGKESTQMEFFNTFNELYANNKQIVISSDRPPDQLVRLDERLRSRFYWKMVAELMPADYETRVAILQKKAEDENLTMDSDLYEVIQLIADRISDNIRVLEGAFYRVISFSNLMDKKIDKSFAKRVLKDIIINGSNNPTPVQIKNVVSKHFNIKINDLESSKRTNQIAYPRQIAMYLCRTMTDFSFPQIGQLFGGKHYTTVMHACDKIQKQLRTDPNLKDVIDELKKEINNVNN